MRALGPCAAAVHGSVGWMPRLAAVPALQAAGDLCAAALCVGRGSGQVYASYRLMRDLGQGATGTGLAERGRALSLEEGRQQRVGGVPLQAPTMKQGLAWQLACRQLMHSQQAQAEALVKADTRAADVKDVHVTLQVWCVCVGVCVCWHAFV